MFGPLSLFVRRSSPQLLASPTPLVSLAATNIIHQQLAKRFFALPADGVRMYTKTDEWVMISNGIATIGITAHAADSLGDIVFVDLPDEGHSVEPNGTILAVESVKAAADIHSPISGKVIESNSALTDAPDTVNNDPEGEGWMVKLELAGEDTVELLNEEEYAQHVAEQAH